MNVDCADREVLEMFFSETGQMLREPLFQGDWQSDDSVFGSGVQDESPDRHEMWRRRLATGRGGFPQP